ncbi:unnamed protein product [Amoebophrya sp. A25]|nr:unnamed protein product [Amoebophrya sp. A25]|eukprot:GSA25T00004932001.1
MQDLPKTRMHSGNVEAITVEPQDDIWLWADGPPLKIKKYCGPLPAALKSCIDQMRGEKVTPAKIRGQIKRVLDEHEKAEEEKVEQSAGGLFLPLHE